MNKAVHRLRRAPTRMPSLGLFLAHSGPSPKAIFLKSSPTVLLPCLPMSLEGSLSEWRGPNLLIAVAFQAFPILASPFLSCFNSTLLSRYPHSSHRAWCRMCPFSPPAFTTLLSQLQCSLSLLFLSAYELLTQLLRPFPSRSNGLSPKLQSQVTHIPLYSTHHLAL